MKSLNQIATNLQALCGKIALCGFLLTSVCGGPLKTSDSFPDITAYELEGTIPQLKGKVVLVDFFASWCTPCQKSFPAMEELQKKYGEKGLVVIAISEDTKKQDMERFLKKHPTTFHILRDSKGKLASELKLPAMPTSYLVDREGVVRAVHNGFHGEDTRKQYVLEIETLLK